MRPSPNDVFAAVETITGADPRDVAGSHLASHRLALDLAVYGLRIECELSLPEIAREVGFTSHSSIHRRLQRNRPLRFQLELLGAIAVGNARRRMQSATPAFARLPEDIQRRIRVERAVARIRAERIEASA